MSEWRHGKLGGLLELRSERNTKHEASLVLTVSNTKGVIPQAENFNNGRILASQDTSGYRVVRKGDYAYNPARINVGSIGRLKDYDTGIISPMYVCFATNASLSGDFLEHFLQTKYFSDAVKKRLSGSVRECLNYSGLCDIDFAYPIDTAEQFRIAAVLTAADEAIAVSRALVDKYAAVKQGLMQDLLTGKIRLAGFSDDWKLTKLSELCRIPTSLVNPQLPAYCNLPHIGSENIEKGTGRLLRYRTAQEDGLISGKYPFTDKDILYSKIRPHLVKACCPRFFGVCGADIYPLRCTEKAIPEYLLYVLLSEHFTGYCISVSMRSKMPKMNQDELYAYACIVPSRQEQIAIADVLTAADERLTAERERLKKLEDVKRGLMDDLLANRVGTDKLQGGI